MYQKSFISSPNYYIITSKSRKLKRKPKKASGNSPLTFFKILKVSGPFVETSCVF